MSFFELFQPTPRPGGESLRSLGAAACRQSSNHTLNTDDKTRPGNKRPRNHSIQPPMDSDEHGCRFAHGASDCRPQSVSPQTKLHFRRSPPSDQIKPGQTKSNLPGPVLHCDTCVQSLRERRPGAWPGLPPALFLAPHQPGPPPPSMTVSSASRSIWSEQIIPRRIGMGLSSSVAASFKPPGGG
jgi:hypothetical protein